MAEDSELTQDEKAKIGKWLTARGVAAQCPTCNRGQLQIGQHMVSLPGYSAGSGFPSLAYPAILLICSNCGYFRPHAAVQMGIVPRKSSQTESNQQPGIGAVEGNHGA